MNKIDIQIYTYENKYPKATQKIIDDCGLHIEDGVAHYSGVINREDWHIQAVQMRAGAGGYKPANILKAVESYGFTGSKATFDNFLSKFARICGFKWPKYEKVDQIREKPIFQQRIISCCNNFYDQSGLDNSILQDIYGDEPVDTFTGEEYNDVGYSQRNNVGKIIGEGDELDLMFKDPGVRSINDDDRKGYFPDGERRLLAKLGR